MIPRFLLFCCLSSTATPSPLPQGAVLMAPTASHNGFVREFSKTNSPQDAALIVNSAKAFPVPAISSLSNSVVQQIQEPSVSPLGLKVKEINSSPVAEISGKKLIQKADGPIKILPDLGGRVLEDSDGVLIESGHGSLIEGKAIRKIEVGQVVEIRCNEARMLQDSNEAKVIFDPTR